MLTPAFCVDMAFDSTSMAHVLALPIVALSIVALPIVTLPIASPDLSSLQTVRHLEQDRRPCGGGL